MKNLEREERSFIFIFIVIVIFTVALRYCFWFTSVLSTALDSIFTARARERKGECICIGIGIRYYDRALREVLVFERY